MRLFNVVTINDKGDKTYMTRAPVNHKEGCTILLKLIAYQWRRKELETVVYDPCGLL